MNWSSVMWSAVAFAVFAAGIGIAWLILRAGERQEARDVAERDQRGVGTGLPQIPSAAVEASSRFLDHPNPGGREAIHLHIAAAPAGARRDEAPA